MDRHGNFGVVTHPEPEDLKGLSFSERLNKQGIKLLKAKNYHSTVTNGHPSLVMFFLSYCGHCHNMAPYLKQLNDFIKNEVSKNPKSKYKDYSVYIVDGEDDDMSEFMETFVADNEKKAGVQYSDPIRMFPTILIYNRQGKVMRFKGNRENAMELVQNMVTWAGDY